MRCLDRNKQTLYYAHYVGKTRNQATGKYEVTHTKPVKFKANISSETGETFTQLFGNRESYDKVIALDKPILDEQTILWVETLPELDDEGNLVVDTDGEVKTPHDYIVKKVAKSLNSVIVAVTKVNVSG